MKVRMPKNSYIYYLLYEIKYDCENGNQKKIIKKNRFGLVRDLDDMYTSKLIFHTVGTYVICKRCNRWTEGRFNTV